jgi:hypothetical protein
MQFNLVQITSNALFTDIWINARKYKIRNVVLVVWGMYDTTLQKALLRHWYPINCMLYLECPGIKLFTWNQVCFKLSHVLGNIHRWCHSIFFNLSLPTKCRAKNCPFLYLLDPNANPFAPEVWRHIHEFYLILIGGQNSL